MNAVGERALVIFSLVPVRPGLPIISSSPRVHAAKANDVTRQSTAPTRKFAVASRRGPLRGGDSLLLTVTNPVHPVSECLYRRSQGLSKALVQQGNVPESVPATNGFRLFPRRGALVGGHHSESTPKAATSSLMDHGHHPLLRTLLNSDPLHLFDSVPFPFLFPKKSTHCINLSQRAMVSRYHHHLDC
jgi:hypothetical protein